MVLNGYCLYKLLDTKHIITILYQLLFLQNDGFIHGQNTQLTSSYYPYNILGTINNLGYVLVLVFSDELAQELNHSKLMSLFVGSLTLLNILIRVLYLKFFVKIKHIYRITLSVVLTILAVLLLILSKVYLNFTLSCIGTLFIGVACVVGEMTNLGFMKGFPPSVISGYSSGTGMSGVLGSFGYLLLKIFKFQFQHILLIYLLFLPVYFFSFTRILKIKLNLYQQVSYVFRLFTVKCS